MEEFSCDICGGPPFSKKSNLMAHLKRFHSDRLEELSPPKKPYRVGAICNICERSYTKYSSLKAHVETFHPDKIDDLPKKLRYPYKCSQCPKQFSKLKSFEAHKRVHERQRTIPRYKQKQLKCPLCEYEDKSKTGLHRHFGESHEISIKPESIKFNGTADFFLWKKEEEEKTRSLFIKNRGSQIHSNRKKYVYACHRSGKYVPKGKGQRRLKSQGSNKINAFCPASIVLTQEADDTVRVEYISTHVGHGSDLAHLLLDEEAKQELAKKIAAKVPLSNILEEIQDSVTNTNFKRIHLLTRKDLYNIENAYNLNSTSIRQKSDESVNEHDWIEELQKSNCVLFHKPQGYVSEEYQFLKGDDFVLILMTEGQKDILGKFGNDCVCVDRTHESNSYGFELVTLMVVDEMREGFPCSFMISSRIDEEVMSLFYACIETNMEAKVSPKFFMSDIQELFYDAWVRIMAPPEYRLYCSWHVARAWRENLAKITSEETQAIVYQHLRSLLEEVDIKVFPVMLETFLNSTFEDDETLEFGNYFLANYVDKVAAWANCYRINSDFDANMNVERMHHTLKHIYFKSSTKNNKLEKSVTDMLKFVRKKLLEQMTTINISKLSSKLKDLRLRHDKSQRLDLNSVMKVKDGWQVSSSLNQKTYFVEQRKLECTCKIVCPECDDACLHQYSCTCIDSSMAYNMCKHIHLVCRYEKGLLSKKDNDGREIVEEIQLLSGKEEVTELGDEMESGENIIEEVALKNEIQDLVSFVDVEESQSNDNDEGFDLEEEKLHLSNWICAEIDKITSVSQLNEVRRLLAPVEHLLDRSS